ncbi:MAG: MarR family winged helix-turn-helix transcriptional regulator [Jatrophihabitans sp.]|uniref:MarR family winged helix-turn-helix transcriptional regulator n=1 Tax=Jatrophihabitans sp. TaxID=1932789 RepID=UPI003F7F81E6
MTSRHGDDAWPLAEIVTRLRRTLRSSVRSEIPWERLPMAQVELLQRLADEPGLRLGDLAARHRLAANTVSTLVQQMVQGGLVERGADPADRRATVLTLTDAGREHLQHWLEANSRRIAGALDALPAADRRAIGNALPALLRLVERLEEQANPDETPRR